MVACGGGRAAVDDEAVPPDAQAANVPLVVLVRYGGIAGTTDRVSVNPSGVATVVSTQSPTPTTRTLPPRDLASLRTALERSQITTLERNYLDPRAADAYQYDVTYRGVTVTADEGVVPPTLRPVVDMLGRLIRE